MKKLFCVLLVLTTAIMVFASGCAYADITEGLIYDESDNTWAAGDEDLTELVDTLYMQLIKPERGVGDIHSCAADLLLFDRALIGGKLINEESLAEMFHMDKGYGCGWVQAKPNSAIFYHGGETYIYKSYNLYAKTKKYGNIYLIQLHPTVAGDQYSNECMLEIIRAVMK